MLEKKTNTWSFSHEGKDYAFEMRKPGFEEIKLALGALTTLEGKLDFIGAGEVIYDTCILSGQKVIDADGSLKAGVCTQLASMFATPAMIELKKN